MATGSNTSVGIGRNVMKTTYAELLVTGLVQFGYAEVPSKTKYRTFVKRGEVDSGMRLFVGPNGALRKGRIASESWSLGEPGNKTPVYVNVLAKAAVAISKTEVGMYGVE